MPSIIEGTKQVPQGTDRLLAIGKQFKTGAKVLLFSTLWIGPYWHFLHTCIAQAQQKSKEKLVLTCVIMCS